MSSFKSFVHDTVSKRFDTPVEEIDFSFIEIEIYKNSGDDEDYPDDGPIVVEINGYVIIKEKKERVFVQIQFDTPEYYLMTQALEDIIKS